VGVLGLAVCFGFEVIEKHGNPFNSGCLPLNYSGNPGVNGVSHRGVNGERWA
jgi:hypothetical protein